MARTGQHRLSTGAAKESSVERTHSNIHRSVIVWKAAVEEDVVCESTHGHPRDFQWRKDAELHRTDDLCAVTIIFPEIVVYNSGVRIGCKEGRLLMSRHRCYELSILRVIFFTSYLC